MNNSYELSDEKKFLVCVLDYLKANPNHKIEFANIDITYIDTEKDYDYYQIKRKLEEEN